MLLEDWNQTPLTVKNLLELKLHSRNPFFLAYLSACGTGRATDDELGEENLHLISAFQLAGFQHVIGTLWEVNDRVCVEVSTRLYEWMITHKMSDESVSGGLHYTIRYLRKQWIEEDLARQAAQSDANIRQETVLENPLRQDEIRNKRDVEICDDSLPPWIPFVHFGDR